VTYFFLKLFQSNTVGTEFLIESDQRIEFSHDGLEPTKGTVAARALVQSKRTLADCSKMIIHLGPDRPVVAMKRD
jgi:hypothetical protein